MTTKAIIPPVNSGVALRSNGVPVGAVQIAEIAGLPGAENQEQSVQLVRVLTASMTVLPSIPLATSTLLLRHEFLSTLPS
jgi:hypothetical protein